MKNHNYNLIKALLKRLDSTWQMDKFCVRDAKVAKCRGCEEIFKKILAADKKSAELLRAELIKHAKGGKLN